MRRVMGRARRAVVVRVLGPAAAKEEAVKRGGRGGRWGGSRGDGSQEKRWWRRFDRCGAVDCFALHEIEVAKRRAAGS